LLGHVALALRNHTRAKHNPATKITNTKAFNISNASKFAFFK